ncbi:unnamed protein product [Pseudo-nitzschia multistriata]|uniref:Uncharacterized protein n=1 Tax=Pseudo-nitzschia multistriata TaxID=183589 RepID=A0A448ZAW7_9STRA|nr:unnamed protein product [Pseudo-nitzschia multistriata]
MNVLVVEESPPPSSPRGGDRAGVEARNRLESRGRIGVPKNRGQSRQQRQRQRRVGTSTSLAFPIVIVALCGCILFPGVNFVGAFSPSARNGIRGRPRGTGTPRVAPAAQSVELQWQPFEGSPSPTILPQVRRRTLRPTRSRSSFPTTTRLTTASGDAETQEPSKNTKPGVFANAAAKFRARPGTYLMIPVIAGFVGWLTNYLAVQMIFYPVQFKGIPIWRKAEVPLGLLGWQGIVPCKTATMSRALVEMVETQLLTVPEAFARLNPGKVAGHLARAVPQLGEEVIRDVVGTAGAAGEPFPLGLWQKVFGGGGWYSGILRFCNARVLTGVVKDLIRNSERIFSLENCVVDQMILDRAKLGQLFQKVGRVELDFLTNSGLWFGFLLGLIQMAVALVWENPWALSIGGTIVGLATNWLALKWIFEPVNPTKIGPFVVQGMFLTRQKEVAAEFSKFFADNIVTSKQIWNSILTDASTRPALSQVLGGHVKRLLSIASFGLFKGLPSPETIGKVTESAITNLPGHLSGKLHTYVDGALGLETTLRTQMEAMSPAKFERVLHPIFEEDELTLIIAGGVLGFIAGLIQQGLETGKIKVPPLPKPLQELMARCKTSCSSAVQRLKCVLKKNNNKEKGSSQKNGQNDNVGYDIDNGDGVSGE